MPNTIYPEPVLDENNAWPGNLIQDLTVKFDARYQADQPSTITCVWSARAKVRGFQTLGATQTSIYTRDYPLVSLQTLTHNDTVSLDIIQDLTLNPAAYIDFSEQAQKQISSSLGREIQIIFEGTYETATEHGAVSVPFASIVHMPLGSEIFTISKSNPYTGAGAITQKQSLSVLTHPFFYLWILLLLAALMLLAVLFFFSRLPGPQEAYATQMKKILRRYGNRMVEIADIPCDDSLTDVHLRRFTGLLRLAEENQKPLFYKSNGDGLPEDGCFYVFDGFYRYCYREDKKIYTK